ncbi:hypothetical protein [Williamwhitmania taraxaci]|uniref:Uncharacterized protein n=1 Tax=Williamwhitmania taraxaci TaxID=1640674 RepID=A0A1G6S042_9BACT|nr:hypothetical protein [Williamwhitmania taraxaci]SDD10229.1 hypothetical protein SAMN05216323_108418 [Williamwhitmania taraxaci]
MRNKFRKIIVLTALIVESLFCFSQSKSNIDSVKVVFSRIEELQRRDTVKLWGPRFSLPLVFVDEKNGLFYANFPIRGGQHISQYNIFQGHLDSLPDSYKTDRRISQDGVFISVVNYLYSEDVDFYLMGLVHEMFHAFQKTVGFNVKQDLPTVDLVERGSALQRLEWIILERTLLTQSQDSIVIYACMSRTVRQAREKVSAVDCQNELCEGSAEYTSLKMLSKEDPDLMHRLELFTNYYHNVRNYTRSGDYYSGLLYALVLDRLGIHWRDSFPNLEPFSIVINRYLDGVRCPSFDVEQVKREFGYDDLERQEQKKVADDSIHIVYNRFSDLRNRGQMLCLPADSIKVQFNNENVLNIDGVGVFFRSASIISMNLDVDVFDGGVLISNNGKTIELPLTITNSVNISESSWINPGWSVVIKRGRPIIQHDEHCVFVEFVNPF